MNKELLEYKNALAHKKCDPEKISRVTAYDSASLDYDVEHYEGIIDPYIIDQTKILRSKSFRRLSSKTQVVYNTDNPHVRTRSSHTNEVVSNAKMISSILGLNVELAESGSYGHDLGHGPTGHLFERAASEYGTNFRHEVFSAITTVFIERGGYGLNLTKDTIGGILNHSQSSDRKNLIPIIDEHQVIKYSDKFGYTFSDINDLRRLNTISEKDYKIIDKYFPGNQRSRVGMCITALVKESAEKGFVSFEESETAQKFKEIRDLMFKEYYQQFDPKVLKDYVITVFDCVAHIKGLENYDPVIVTALMTDKELSNLIHKIITTNLSRIDLSDFKDYGVYEILQNKFLEGKKYSDLETDLELRLKR